MSNPAIATALFFSSVVLMIAVGGGLQGLHPQYGLIASGLVCILLPALVCVALLRRGVGAQPPPAFPRWRTLGLSAPWLIWVVVTSVVLGFAANAWTGMLAELVPALKPIAAAYQAMFEGLMYPEEPLHRAAAIVAVVVVAPLCEETLFRGVILPLQRDSDRGLVAVLLLNGLLFALLHMNPLSFVALVAIGVFFAHLVVLTGSIWPSVIAHATLNFANGVVAAEIARSTEVVPAEPTLVDYGLAAALFTPLVAACWFFGARRLQAGRQTDA